MPKKQFHLIKVIKKLIKTSIMFDDICIICGFKFQNLGSMTMEHILPKSLGGTLANNNIAPTHSYCNNIRGNGSIIKASKKIDRLRRQLDNDSLSKMISKPLLSRNSHWWGKSINDVKNLLTVQSKRIYLIEMPIGSNQYFQKKIESTSINEAINTVVKLHKEIKFDINLIDISVI